MNSTDAMYGAAPKRFQMPICDKTLSTEISTDFTLPDYQVEIRRILRVTPQILPPAKYVSGNSAELNGNIDYELLYVGSDGALYSAPLSAEYSITVPLEISSNFDLNEGVTLIADISNESTTTRVSAPRRLGIKCRLACHVKAYGMMIADERLSGEVDPMSIERLDMTCDTSLVLSGFGETIELSDEFSPSSSDMRVVSAVADANIVDVTASEGSAAFSGEITLKLILSPEGNSAECETAIRKITFGDQIEIDDLPVGADCRGRAYVSDVKVTVEEGRILCDLNVIPEITAYSTIPMTYTCDIYSTKNYSECAYREYSLPTVFSVWNGNFSQSERIPLAETTIQPRARLVDIWCKPTIEKLDTERGKYAICGQCRYMLLLESEGEYFTSELSAPFRYESDTPVREHVGYDAECGVLSCHGRIDGGSIAIDAELCINSALFGSDKIKTLSEVRFGDTVTRYDGDIVVCFPAPDDTAWSVSKKYFVPVSKIMGVSSPTDTLSGYVVINS